jgi:tetratricopeptide (TPR) repeat protein
MRGTGLNSLTPSARVAAALELLQRARELYESGRVHDALEAAQAACDRKPKDAEAWWVLGCISRYENLPAASDTAFRKAAALSRNHPLPHRVTREDFEALVRRQLESLSPDARRRLTGVRVEIRDLPGREDVKRGTSPDALTNRKRGAEDVLFLYQVNHENRSGSETDLAALVTRSLSRA